MKNLLQRYSELMTAQISNPLGPDTGLLDIFSLILNGLILIATPIVILTVIYSGFLFVTAQGNVEKLQKAKTAITYALIGALILIGGQAISQLIQNTFDSF